MKNNTRKVWPGLHGSEPVPARSDTGERIFCSIFGEPFVGVLLIVLLIVIIFVIF